MSRILLNDAANEVETAKEHATDGELRERLELFSDQLRSQADRETTPALGALDRIQVKLREIEQDTDSPVVSESIHRAREGVLSFLGTLDDRGMRQHTGGRH